MNRRPAANGAAGDAASPDRDFFVRVANQGKVWQQFHQRGAAQGGSFFNGGADLQPGEFSQEPHADHGIRAEGMHVPHPTAWQHVREP